MINEMCRVNNILSDVAIPIMYLSLLVKLLYILSLCYGRNFYLNIYYGHLGEFCFVKE